MCGIAGSAGIPVEPGWAKKADELLFRRGPDGKGELVYYPAVSGQKEICYNCAGNDLQKRTGIYFLHRRLAIIDPAGGAQPFTGGSASHPVCMMVNGEIYNCRELRQELEKNGHTFSSASDSEVILHGWESWGSAIFNRLDGMFACAIFDAEKQKIILARDPYGQKPLYYTLPDGGGIVFASTLPVITAHPAADKTLSSEALCDFFENWYVPDGTVYSSIGKIAPGHFAEYSLTDASFRQSKYFSLDFSRKCLMSHQEAEEKFLHLFASACRKRMLADVPVGTFLSGGTDSLAVTAMVLAQGAKNLEVATIGFDNAVYDEMPGAEYSAAQLRQHSLDSFIHRKKTVSGNDFLLLKKMWQDMGEPFGDASLMPTAALCSFTAEHLKCVLSGDGADEFFAGYERYRAMTLIRKLSGDFSGSRNLLNFTAGVLSSVLPSGRERSKAGRLKRFLKALAMGYTPEAYSFITGKASPSLFKKTAGKRLRDIMESRRKNNMDMAGRIAAIADNITTCSKDEIWSIADINNYLPGDILPKVDTASMSNSLEVRSPFLDRDLTAFAAALQWQFKTEKGKGKAIIQRALSRKFPFIAEPRKKRGFGIPLADYLSGCWRKEAEKALSSPLLTEKGIISPDAAKILTDRKDKEAVELKWSFIVLADFMERYCG